MDIRSVYDKYFPRSIKKTVRRLFGRTTLDFGDFARATPISSHFGYDRGGPIDRIYIEDFLQKNAHRIKGRVLEIGDNDYTLKFGKSNVKISDILHVHEGNPSATIIGDLTTLQIPDETFDCIILTQTLHLIYDFKTAMKNCHRILKRGGALLITVPGIVNIPHDEWGATSYYSFTSHLMEKICEDLFKLDACEFTTYGNVYTAAMFLYGIGAPEINENFFQIHDPHYQVLISACVVKSSESSSPSLHS